MAAKKRKKNKLAFPLGVLTVILAIIGLVTVVGFSVDTVKNLTDKTAQKKEYEEMLKPVVLFDPDPFDDLTQADVSQLLNSAVWALLMSDEGADKYPYSEGENFGIVVPQADIEKYFVSLFGTEIDIASMHSSIDMSGYDITYDAALKSYILPITGVESAYTPKVYDIEKQGSSLILSVGYIGNSSWVQVADGEYTAPEPDKYMKITLRERSGGMMYVSSIQSTDGQEVIGTTQRREEPVETEPVETLPAIAETQSVPATDENGEIITTEALTDENGEPITEEPLTDENGEVITTEPLTDENGEFVTEEITEEAIEEENEE
ncbi:MAG: hypothetical protein IJE19_09690 [Clostridia bacterium]|nr:hypothetical protein [Clostridia bacterium]